MTGERFPASQAARLDDPARLLWLPPGEAICALTLLPDEAVADVGAGTGYFTLPLARAVGAEGKVYAVDAQAGMLARLSEKLSDAGVTNVIPIQAEADETGLPGSSCDLFFLANVWHEIEDRGAVLVEAWRVLKLGGRIAILDWRPDVEPEHGPPLAHRVDPLRTITELRSAGFDPGGSAEVGLYSWLVQGGKIL